jgi:hypothetical protein
MGIPQQPISTGKRNVLDELMVVASRGLSDEDLEDLPWSRIKENDEATQDDLYQNIENSAMIGDGYKPGPRMTHAKEEMPSQSYTLFANECKVSSLLRRYLHDLSTSPEFFLEHVKKRKKKLDKFERGILKERYATLEALKNLERDTTSFEESARTVIESHARATRVAISALLPYRSHMSQLKTSEASSYHTSTVHSDWMKWLESAIEECEVFSRKFGSDVGSSASIDLGAKETNHVTAQSSRIELEAMRLARASGVGKHGAEKDLMYRRIVALVSEEMTLLDRVNGKAEEMMICDLQDMKNTVEDERGAALRASEKLMKEKSRMIEMGGFWPERNVADAVECILCSARSLCDRLRSSLQPSGHNVASRTLDLTNQVAALVEKILDVVDGPKLFLQSKILESPSPSPRALYLRS